MISASAPGKIVLMGEHAVVFGKPAIALAVNLRLRCRIDRSNENLVNGQPLALAGNPYLSYIVNKLPSETALNQHFSFDVSSDIPAGSGLGSSAALSVATMGALAALKNTPLNEEEISKKAFNVEYSVQGRASPMDSSVSAHGGGIFLDSKKGPNFLWESSKNDKSWFIHDLKVPEMGMVIGYTGIRKPTGPMVAKVAAYCKRTKFACEIIDEIGDITLEGAEALNHNDIEKLGRLMTKNHKLLAILGVSSPELQKLVDAATPYSYGAKLTGGGGGGSMIALTDKPEKVYRAIELRGGIPYIVRTGVDGIKII